MEGLVEGSTHSIEIDMDVGSKSVRKRGEKGHTTVDQYTSNPTIQIPERKISEHLIKRVEID